MNVDSLYKFSKQKNSLSELDFNLVNLVMFLVNNIYYNSYFAYLLSEIIHVTVPHTSRIGVKKNSKECEYDFTNRARDKEIW